MSKEDEVNIDDIINEKSSSEDHEDKIRYSNKMN